MKERKEGKGREGEGRHDRAFEEMLKNCILI